MSPRKQRRTASEGAVTSCTKTAAGSSPGRSVGRNAAPSQSANAWSKCGAVTVVRIDGADDIRMSRQILGDAAVQTVDRGPGTFGSLPQRQGRWVGDDAQTADRDRVVSGCRPHTLETVGDIGQQL